MNNEKFLFQSYQPLEGSDKHKNAIWRKMNNHRPKKSKKYFTFILSAAVLAIACIVILQQFEFKGKSEFIQGDKIDQFEELNRFERVIQFPTYSPFPINELRLSIEQTGPMEYENEEIVWLEEGNPKYQVIVSQYFSDGDDPKYLEIRQTDSTWSKLENYSSYSKKDRHVYFGNDILGLYYFNGNAQMLFWEDQGVTFEMFVTVGEPEQWPHNDEPIPKEELIKIAESFKNYTNTTSRVENEMKNETLDTSKLILEENDVEGDISDEDFEPEFISYVAPSLEVALEAIPFEIKLPKELPFDDQPFKTMRLWDWSKEGKEIEVEFATVSDTKEEVENNTGEGKVLSITVRNFEMNLHNPMEKEEVTITNELIGQFNDSSLTFEVDGIYYKIQFLMGEFENPKEELINIARQML